MGSEMCIRDSSKAIYWFRKAADSGHSAAQFNVGLYYAQGIEVAQNWELAFYWYSLSAEQGYQNAQQRLADCFEKGLGTPQNLERAEYWRRKAERN